MRLPYSALCWMLLPVLPRECICVSKGTDCSVTLCCGQECRQCVCMSLHPSAHSRTAFCRASIHPSEQDWRVLGLHMGLLVEVCYLGIGALMKDSFVPIAMTRLPFPGSCLGKQQKKRLCCPGILSAVSCLSLPQPTPSRLEDCCSLLNNDIY